MVKIAASMEVLSCLIKNLHITENLFLKIFIKRLFAINLLGLENFSFNYHFFIL